MINIRTLRKVQEDGGLTLKNGKLIEYKSGYQVAYETVIETDDINLAMQAIRSCKDGNCGVWLSKGIYYIDRSKRVNTKLEAMVLGYLYEQQTVLQWKTMNCLPVRL